MKSINSLLLAGTALLAMQAVMPLARAEAQAPRVVAQAAPADKKEPEKKEAPPAAKPPAPPAAKPAAPPAPPPPAAKPAAPPPAAQKPPAPPPPAAPQAPKPPAPAAAPPQQPPAAQQREQRREGREERREERRDERREQRNNAAPRPAPAAPQQQSQPQQPQSTPPAAAKPPATPPAATAPTTAPQQQQTRPQDRQDRRQDRGQRRDERRQQQPAATPAPQQPAQQQAPAQQPAQAAPQQQQPAPAVQRAAPTAVPALPTQPRDAREFIRRDNDQAARTMEQVRSERRQVQQGNRTVISEGDRTIVRQGNRTIIRHSEAQRFAIGARDVRVDRRGAQTTTTIQRPNNITIINITDADGRLVRRVRRDAQGRQIILIDNSAAMRRGSYFVSLPPPRVRIPRERYIVDAWDASPDIIMSVFFAAPVERLDRRYSVEEVRFSEPLRARMPRVDLDLNFETGSWQLTPEQIDKLSVIADGLNRAIQRNPREVFMVEGYTDAVGNPEDNLSLSDRRAEAVAVALTEQFQVPAENLVTQGYGEENLKEPTDGPSRVNRRVAVRRITPLIADAR